ncbi:MarR family winged helix-turn-helix transcriptional regulator [Nocardioides sp.]|uniref:MarR family winged helix-turn-helix transcriptional regulator n=1 Tax=Nocardioides sp. TaxID=35761 RepID=UPI0039E710B2
MAIEETTGELLMAVARSLRQRFAAAMERYDVTPGQARALRVVATRPAIRPSALADELRISPRSATEVIDGLEARGLVARRPDPTDRRATEVAPTPEGLRVHELIHEARRAESERFLATLPAADRAELDRLLRALSR